MVSFLVVSLIMLAESPIILVESLMVESLMVEPLIEEDESITVVVDVSVDSVLELEQAVAKATIDNRKNADFFMVVLN